MFSFCVIIGRLDYRLCKDVVLNCVSQQETYLSSHVRRPICRHAYICRVFPGPLQRAKMYKKWPHIPFLLSQPQYGTDTREDWTVSQHTQPLRSPITFSHLVRHTQTCTYYVRDSWFSVRLITYLLIVVISVFNRSINIAGLTVSLQNSGKSKHKHI